MKARTTVGRIGQQDYSNPTRMQRGAKFLTVLPCSEVVCHLRLAEAVVQVEIVGEYPMAQIFNLEDQPISFPITLGEAGIYSDEFGWYCYPPMPELV